jgi:hypothetical protein
MGQLLHGTASTTHAVSAAIQRSQASLSALSRELGIDLQTVAKWRKRAVICPPLSGPETMIVWTTSEGPPVSHPSRG